LYSYIALLEYIFPVRKPWHFLSSDINREIFRPVLLKNNFIYSRRVGPLKVFFDQQSVDLKSLQIQDSSRRFLNVEVYKQWEKLTDTQD